MSTSGKASDQSFLIWGGNSWIARQLLQLLRDQGKRVVSTTVRMENRESVEKELDQVRPTHVLNCAGYTGVPNVDWCEDNKEKTIRSNVIGTINLVDCCFVRGIHVTTFSTACLYAYDEAHPIGGPGFRETDAANFAGNFYSATKWHIENVIKHYGNCLILRIRMPVSDDLHPRSVVTKITQYDRVVNVPNSHSVLHELLPAAIILTEHNETGVFNFVNPGAISHNEVLSLFKKHVRPSFTWKNFSVEEQNQVLKSGRSNCMLDTTKVQDTLRKYGYEIPEVHVACEQAFIRMARNGVH
ncbi:hypothetical protein COCC4DRAFT_41113 [Bipolaris maydis ATCC 48331]|uniref:RmlD-like substrate binding domain-containing protein n=2 Tax=Cochliobolus heterostrophus TaxID=5016 RepID=M2VB96_COCH5|nr:uncharacterized protein COCC4DRAFT_41113 [Bipolaris maydis ATCC 48331]EMD97212.1 hypothetical protein COCHEDRAFT_1150873 [Bipolaris maydis C5]KAJ5029653.1 hypothetical protein J3E73DRAFT_388998 [Bipolaris maydis]ENI04327.1 hypothetical protein COCC4DRAFT_41113 [Bipolaris maydis ATCC 48331]KAJ5040656.1 NAD dependent epimerase/dehydratase [Bipolaris maydis]KAJ5061592.1 NAD dependent epimerase/dehydratase [Bipolaris maydis]